MTGEPDRMLIYSPRAVPNEDGTITVYLDYTENGRKLILTKKDAEELALILEGINQGVYINSYNWNGALTVEGGKGKDEIFNEFNLKEMSGAGFCLNTMAEDLVKKGRFTGARVWLCIGEYGTLAKNTPVFWGHEEDDEEDDEEDRGPQTSILDF